jgi:hypothetical protein
MIVGIRQLSILEDDQSWSHWMFSDFTGWRLSAINYFGYNHDFCLHDFLLSYSVT